MRARFLRYVLDDLARPLLQHTTTVGRIEAHTIAQSLLHLGRQLSLREIDDSQQHVLEFQIAVPALNALINEGPYFLRQGE